MNYDPNTKTHAIGDLVLHDADAKHPAMLMRVVRYRRDGRCVTRYTGSRAPGGTPLPRRQWVNELRFLHEPSRFGVEMGV